MPCVLLLLPLFKAQHKSECPQATNASNKPSEPSAQLVHLQCSDFDINGLTGVQVTVVKLRSLKLWAFLYELLPCCNPD